jgi:ribA/ribD-fused uncharacterized protein
MNENRLTLDTPSQVFFYEQDHYYLSNFSAFAINWMGLSFPTSEHAYQWTKFADARNPHSDIRAMIRFAPSAHEAFKLAERYAAHRDPDWNLVKFDRMKAILIHKANQHEYVSRKLLETGERELVENSWRDDVWGWGPNRDGQNQLGKLWMQVREELRASANHQESVT